MKQQWKRGVPLIFAGGLMACSSAVPVHHTSMDDLALPPGGTETIVHPQLLEPAPDSPPVTPDEAVAAKVKSPELKPENEPAEKPEQQNQNEPEPAHEDPHNTDYTTMGDGLLLLGQREWVSMPGFNFAIRARIKPGQQLSSVYASDMHFFKRSGQQWVTFHLQPAVANTGVSVPVYYWTKEKTGNSVDNIPVVIRWIEIGDLKEPVEFKLYQQQEGSLPSVVLGDNFLRENAVVDSTRSYVQPKPLSE